MKQYLLAAMAGSTLCLVGACATGPAPGTAQASNNPTPRDNCVVLTGSRVCRDPSKVAGDVTILSPKAMREQPTSSQGGLGSLTPGN